MDCRLRRTAASAQRKAAVLCRATRRGTLSTPPALRLRNIALKGVLVFETVSGGDNSPLHLKSCIHPQYRQKLTGCRRRPIIYQLHRTTQPITAPHIVTVIIAASSVSRCQATLAWPSTPLSLSLVPTSCQNCKPSTLARASAILLQHLLRATLTWTNCRLHLRSCSPLITIRWKTRMTYRTTKGQQMAFTMTRTASRLLLWSTTHTRVINQYTTPVTMANTAHQQSLIV